jgi:hypothetical protein
MVPVLLPCIFRFLPKKRGPEYPDPEFSDQLVIFAPTNEKAIFIIFRSYATLTTVIA